MTHQPSWEAGYLVGWDDAKKYYKKNPEELETK